MPDSVSLHEDLEDSEDTLSFCDLSLHNNDDDDDELKWEDSSTDDSHTSSVENEFFEFSSDLSAKTYPSENIIFCGKLISYNQPISDHTQKPTSFEFHRQLRFEPQSSRWGSDRGRVMSSNCSLGHDIFQTQSASRSRTSPTPSSSYRAPGKSIRYSVKFGLAKFSPEMELKDIRSRQNRLSQSSIGPAFHRGETVPVKSGRGKGSWGLLRAFGCKGQASSTGEWLQPSLQPNLKGATWTLQTPRKTGTRITKTLRDVWT